MHLLLIDLLNPSRTGMSFLLPQLGLIIIAPAGAIMILSQLGQTTSCPSWVLLSIAQDLYCTSWDANLSTVLVAPQR